jgi:TatA/E family protein of Tat protein translocase
MTHPVFALGLPHGSEWLLIFLAIVLLFGADKIPKLARGFGRSLGEFKKAKEEFEKEVSSAATAQDKKPDALADASKPAPPANTATSVDELTKKS